MNKDILPITHLPVGRVPEAVIVCGDPGRATKTAELLENASLLSEHREYRCYTGLYNGQEVGVCSHGIGAPGAAIAFEELIAAGAKRLLRAGTCGGLQPAIQSGDIVVVTAAVDSTGYGRETVPPGFPAAADAALTTTLMKQANKQSNHTIHSGPVLTRDNFYAGVGVAPHLDYKLMSAANVQAVEMECAALFIVGTLRKVKTAAILVVDGNVLGEGGEMMETYDPGQEVVKIAVEAALHIALKTLTSHEIPG